MIGISAGAVIWISCRPLIRLMICVLSGYFITKADIFPPVATRSTGQLLLNILFPCLMFSRIIPAFNTSNIHALGPLILVSVLYELIGMLIAWVIGKFFWVPHRFRYGLLVAGCWGNVGDLPTSVLLSLTAAEPFHKDTDQNLSIAYISAFILVFMVTLFPCGGHKLIALDYVGPDVESEEIIEAMRIKRKKLFHTTIRQLRHHKQPETQETDLENHREKSVTRACSTGTLRLDQVEHVHDPNAGNHTPHDDGETVIHTDIMSSPIYSPTPTEIGVMHNRSEFAEAKNKTTSWDSPQSNHSPGREGGVLPTTNDQVSTLSSVTSVVKPAARRFTQVYSYARDFVKSLLMPVSMSIILSFPIALVKPLKALFMVVPGTNMPSAPDGQPPLAFILDTASFIGAASVPLGLICLGSALARLNLPRNQWRTLPLGAIATLALGKLVIMPVLGVLICQGLVKVGVIAAEDKVLRFVCIFLSCLPTATTQVFLTQVYSGTGSAEHLSAFLIPQYILMVVTMTALTAYTLQLIF
ncbi:hypothetical protein AMATHDRAFT_67133 [Amanita thiersii Skay4041]|uniref:Auxin efflux carrier n=1 Tax=Amanita thiersii Skay4041 TaxID=703135 RepID=A0A2A9NJ02_9AGAR|nr:hypothetical protein AMATHDRAFT_67133 [Amanita thiersii Skay4041]